MAGIIDFWIINPERRKLRMKQELDRYLEILT